MPATRRTLCLAPLLLLLGGCGQEPLGRDAFRDDTAQADTAPDLTAPDLTDAAPVDLAEITPPEDTRTEDAADIPVRPGLGPPFPIVLAHGMAGFEHLANSQAMPYWFGVREHLEALGEIVHVTEVDPFNSSDVRGAQLAVQIEDYLEASGYAQVVIVAHSQGGLDARWVAHHHPDWVAAVFTVATPHRGTPVSDIILGIIQDERVHDLVDALVNVFGGPLYDELGNESSLFAPIRLFSSTAIADFNARITDAKGVAYYSVGGRSGDAPSDAHCFVADSPEFVDRYWDAVDPVDPLLWLSEALVASASEGPNDGLVPVESARWGRFLGCIPADHMDEVGHLVGDHPGGRNTFDHLAFYQGAVEFLRSEGF